MNALGLTLLGTITHATAFAFFGAILYVALRRSSPAAGALAAGSSLLIMAIVSAFSFGAWPRWYTFTAPGVMAPAPAPVSTEPSRVKARLPGADVWAGGSPDATDSRMSSGDRSETAASSQSSTYALLRELSRAVTAPAAAQQPWRWGWPEWLTLGFFASLFVGFARLGLGLLAVAQPAVGKSSSRRRHSSRRDPAPASAVILHANCRGPREFRAANARNAGLATAPPSAAIRLA